ncbi:MAG: UDP-N-acetylglucosamine diphosphorylase, partial [Verrucomicrobiae bacterium]|nr:UDP-N-acetylglucosamine diphosphorylase [Verrucomicrobiae bacterium]
MFRPEEYLDLARTAHRELFAEVEFVWDALKKIGAYLEGHLEPANRGRVMGHAFVGERVYIGDGTIVEPGAVIKGPAWIGRNCQVRSGAYIRENVILGDWVVAGNSCEFKNSLVFDGCEVPHFNYVGDSILGHKAHIGAGVILSNVKLDRSE